jgi:hypothetical protein
MHTRSSKNILIKAFFLIAVSVICFPIIISQASSESTMSWRYDADWNSWTTQNVEQVGANQGLRLKRDSTNKYVQNGYATYKFSPGGVSKWTSASLGSSSTSTDASSSIWLGQLNDGMVSQVGLDGVLDAQWGAGRNPTNIAVGCNLDAWVANESTGAGAGTADSITHIVPSLNKSITRSIGGGYGKPTSISVKCSLDGNSSVWVGLDTGKKIIKIDATAFDTISPDTTIVDGALSGSAIDLPSCGDSCPYASAIDSDNKYLYVVNPGNHLIKIDTDTSTVDGSFVANVTGENVVADGYGNVYLANPDNTNKGVYRVNRDGSTVSFPTSFRTSGIAIIPRAEGATEDTIAVSTNQGSGDTQLCLASISNSESTNPTIGAYSCQAVVGSGNTGNLDYDPNTGDIYLAIESSSKVYKFVASNNYNGSTLYQPNGSGETFLTKGDFIGSSLGLSSGDLVAEFSSDNSKWYSATDMSNSLVPDSSDLYMRVRFSGNEQSSPILKSLTVNYQPQDNLGPTIFIEKKTFIVSTDGKSSQASASYYPGDQAVVRIRLRANFEKIEGISIRDSRPEAIGISNIINASSEKSQLCGLSASDQIIGASGFDSNADGANSSWNNLNIEKNQDYYLCYKYQINSSQEPKNLLRQVQVDAISKKDGGVESTIASSNNYILIKGTNYIDSQSATKALDNVKTPTVARNDDILSPSNISVTSSGNSGDVYLKSAPFYLFRRGLGENSRGGTLLSLPVTVEDYSGSQLATNSAYMLYNPAYYVFGDVFSGSNYSGNSLDYGSRSLSISKNTATTSDKQNANSSQYDYDFDKSSVIYWDSGNEYKNKQMTDNINKYTSTSSRPGIVCELSNTGALKSALNLNNKDCSLNMTDTSNVYPDGRVWYLKSNSGTIDIGKPDGSSTNVNGRGTIIIDTDSLVRINGLNFGSQASLGLVVIGGGRVEFSKYASFYRGVIFNPSSSESGGKISFETGEGAKAIRIYGSLVADTIEFSPRSRTAADDYSIMIYSDSKTLNQPLPVFGGTSDIFKN